MLVMDEARKAIRHRAVDTVVAGDFNTFDDRNGACYSALVSAADGLFVDIRDVPNVVEVNYGRGDSSGRGETDPYARQYGDQRYSQIFVNSQVRAARTGVIEETFSVTWSNRGELLRPTTSPSSPTSSSTPSTGAAVDIRRWASPRRLALVGLILLALTAFGVMGWMVYEMAGGRNIECRFECRDVRNPWSQDALPVAAQR